MSCPDPAFVSPTPARILFRDSYQSFPFPLTLTHFSLPVRARLCSRAKFCHSLPSLVVVGWGRRAPSYLAAVYSGLQWG